MAAKLSAQELMEKKQKEATLDLGENVGAFSQLLPGAIAGLILRSDTADMRKWHACSSPSVTRSSLGKRKLGADGPTRKSLRSTLRARKIRPWLP